AVVEDITAQRGLRMQLEFLARAGKILGSSLNLEQTLNHLAHLAVSAIADWCGVDLVDESGNTGDYVAVAHRDPAQVELVRELRRRYPPRLNSTSGAERVIATGKSQLVRRVDPLHTRRYARDASHLEFLEKLNLQAILIVPLLERGRV